MSIINLILVEWCIFVKIFINVLLLSVFILSILIIKIDNGNFIVIFDVFLK